MISQVSPGDTGGTLSPLPSVSTVPQASLLLHSALGEPWGLSIPAGRRLEPRQVKRRLGSRKCAPTAHLEGLPGKWFLDVYGFRQLLAERDLEKLRRAVDLKPSALGLRSAVI